MNDLPSPSVAISQSNYIPWRGYFDLIDAVDEFIIFDDRQFTKRDWRNRNIVLHHGKSKWLTIPVETKGKYHQRIDETRIQDTKCARSHWDTICNSYGSAPYWHQFESALSHLWLDPQEDLLTDVNHRFLIEFCKRLGIETRFTRSSDYDIAPDLVKTDRLVALCTKLGASSYLSGPSAKEYIKPELFSASNIQLAYMDYSRYLSYEQHQDSDFVSGVSIIDTICNLGFEHTIDLIRSCRYVESEGVPRESDGTGSLVTRSITKNR